MLGGNTTFRVNVQLPPMHCDEPYKVPPFTTTALLLAVITCDVGPARQLFIVRVPPVPSDAIVAAAVKPQLKATSCALVLSGTNTFRVPDARAANHRQK
jgi:hypothetical protein